MHSYHLSCLKDYPRIDLFIAEQISHCSRSFLQKNMEGLLVNKKPRKISQSLLRKDEIQFYLKERKIQPPHALYQKIDILYEDEELIVLSKPAGILSHPKNENVFNNDSIAEYIQNKITDKEWQTTLPYRKGIVHRLDRETTGLMVCVKTNCSLKIMKEQFQKREVTKNYFALVHGNVLQGSGEIIKNIGKDPRYPMKKKITPFGKEAITYYKVMERFEKFTLVDINLITGRTHQIRLHFADFNHFVIGDKLYGKKANDENSLFLCCYSLSFKHPTNGEKISFKIPLPDFFKERIEKTKKERKKV